MNVLIVDDDANIAMLCERILKGAGFAASVVNSAEEALAFLAGQPVDILLTDIQMPSMSGIDLIRAVRPKYPELDIVIMTSYPTADTIINGLKLGAYDYITKPIDAMILKAALRRCRERRFLQDQLARAADTAERLAARVEALAPDVPAEAKEKLEAVRAELKTLRANTSPVPPAAAAPPADPAKK